MKYYIRSIVGVFFSILLLSSTVLPIVSAQRFSNTNTATTEQETNLFEKLKTEDRTKNALFLAAFEDYQATVEEQYIELTEDETY